MMTSIPLFAGVFNLMRISAVMVGYGPGDHGFHGANEPWSIEMLRRRVETAIPYLDELAQLPRGVDTAATGNARGRATE